ncbi:ectoine synthase [Halomonas sp. KAO]|uniref:ectoine synthase n=1 Tax=unclassified Halomonas TaxID=2609666 RepID=UPI0018A05EFF|nr:MULTISPECIES: ectoine synthase [unclassified Halomonas]MBF7051828.1 ectoine synthase [Halomonas sp. KAO]MDT0502364.1 ectoine synthase [Halomonas sp. PAR7]MDT0510917.1 ectoine synthase [Halomonas sp. LES1]MDT0592759.1 ectoine synthase [Halomonas sp. PAR8]
MIVRTHKDAEDNAIDEEKFISRRYTLRKDGMGHSLHETTIKPGQALHMWYRNHKESVICIEGRGQIEDLTEGGKWDLEPGVMYALDKNQQHILSSEKGMTVLCVFTPALVGPEDHDEQGSYPLLDDDGSVLQR